jgi:predicted nucleotidyltransferase component of viral defense system
MNAAHTGLSQSVQVRLVRHAKEIGVDPNLVLTRYGVERFLYRLSRSPHAERFVLKGALLLIVWLGETLRPTRDADLLGFGELSDDALKQIVRDVCKLEVEPDALTFLPDTVDVQPIREEDAYGGRRVTLEARLGPARLRIQVDVGIGDAITPGPQWLEYPSLLDLPRPRLRAYPRETVVAEKLHAMVMLGTRNSRMKDYFDLHALLREDALDPTQLAQAIASTFERRRTDIPPDVPSGLSDAFSADAACQTRWNAFLAKNRLQGPSLTELVPAIRERLAPVLQQARGEPKR